MSMNGTYSVENSFELQIEPHLVFIATRVYIVLKEIVKKLKLIFCIDVPQRCQKQHAIAEYDCDMPTQ